MPCCSFPERLWSLETLGGVYKCFGHNSTRQHISAWPVCSCVAWRHTAFNLLAARLNVPVEALHNSWGKRKGEKKHDESTVAIHVPPPTPLFTFNWMLMGRDKRQKEMYTGSRAGDLRLKQQVKMCRCGWVCLCSTRSWELGQNCILWGALDFFLIYYAGKIHFKRSIIWLLHILTGQNLSDYIFYWT